MIFRKTSQILNLIRRDENGEALAGYESATQALNACFDPDKNALRIRNIGGTVVGADGSKLGVWDQDDSYDSPDLTTRNGVIYLALQASQNKPPESNPDYWKSYLVPADVLAMLISVDGDGSGLDADLLDGNEATAFSLTSHNHDTEYADIAHESDVRISKRLALPPRSA